MLHANDLYYARVHKRRSKVMVVVGESTLKIRDVKGMVISNGNRWHWYISTSHGKRGHFLPFYTLQMMSGESLLCIFQARVQLPYGGNKILAAPLAVCPQECVTKICVISLIADRIYLAKLLTSEILLSKIKFSEVQTGPVEVILK